MRTFGVLLAFSIFVTFDLRSLSPPFSTTQLSVPFYSLFILESLSSSHIFSQFQFLVTSSLVFF